MSANWVTGLDMLAQNGVIEYDAASHVLGTPARYVGNPPLLPPPIPGAPNGADSPQLPAQPKIDEYKKPQNIVKNQSWKKWTLGAVLTALTVAIITKFKFKPKVKP